MGDGMSNVADESVGSEYGDGGDVSGDGAVGDGDGDGSDGDGSNGGGIESGGGVVGGDGAGEGRPARAARHQTTRHGRRAGD